MRKILLVCAFAALGLGAFAQNTGKDRLTQLENMKLEKKDSVKVKAEKDYKLVDFQLLEHFGYGWHLVSAPEFNKGFRRRNGEFFLNAAQLEIRPAGWISAGLGIDLKWQNFTPAGSNVFSKDASGDVIIEYIDPATDPYEKRVSTLHSFSLAAPLTLDFHLGPAGVTLGAELVYTPASFVRINDACSFEMSDYRVRTRGIGGVPAVSWNAFASLNLGLTGIYFRYYPRQPLVRTAPFSFVTLGVVFSSKGL